MAFKIVPAGLTDYPALPPHEIIETFLSDNWLESFTPPKSKIKFSFLVYQQVGINQTNNSLKCYDGGNAGDDQNDGTTNDNFMVEKKITIVEIQNKTISNLINDIPLEIHQMTNTIKSLINTNKRTLKNQGIHVMRVLNTEPVVLDEKVANVWVGKINILTTQFFEMISM